jgi:hypothetical protein
MKYRVNFKNHDFVEIELDAYISRIENEKRAIILAQAEQIKNNRPCLDISGIVLIEPIIRTVNFSAGAGWLNIYTNIKGYAQGGGIYKSEQLAKDVAKAHCKGCVFINWRKLVIK